MSYSIKNKSEPQVYKIHLMFFKMFYNVSAIFYCKWFQFLMWKCLLKCFTNLTATKQMNFPQQLKQYCQGHLFTMDTHTGKPRTLLQSGGKYFNLKAKILKPKYNSDYYVMSQASAFQNFCCMYIDW